MAKYQIRQVDLSLYSGTDRLLIEVEAERYKFLYDDSSYVAVAFGDGDVVFPFFLREGMYLKEVVEEEATPPTPQVPATESTTGDVVRNSFHVGNGYELRTAYMKGGVSNLVIDVYYNGSLLTSKSV